MVVGVPKEILEGERRVAITPSGASALAAEGHQVLVQAGAGAGVGLSDEDYLRVGAKILATAEEVWGEAELIVKVKGPLRQEFPLIRGGQVIFSFLHLAAFRELLETLLDKEAVGIACETVQKGDGSLPILSPMSRIAGRLAVQEGAHYLLADNGGKGVLLGGTAGVAPARVLILGGGMVGTAACRLAVAMGAQVTLLDIDQSRLSTIQELVTGRLTTFMALPYHIEEEIVKADLVIGAAYLPGARTPRLVGRELVGKMEAGSVIVDVSVDQGGCFETSRPTTVIDPTYMECGVIHYCAINMPALVARTSTYALTDVTLPYTLKLASLGYLKAAESDQSIMKGINVAQGEVIHPAVAAAFDLPCGKL